jgi:hypothetical protein
MSSICLIDTSVFTNLLNVPGRNQDKSEVIQAYQEYVELNCKFILPIATILETGNHIAQNGNGRVRRATAQRFINEVKAAFDGLAPWSPAEIPTEKEILVWLEDFPQKAGQNKSPDKINEGTSLGDLTIIKEFDKCCARFSMSEIFVWSLDSDLQRCHYRPYLDCKQSII